jgi:hypothetical protein
MGCRDIIDISMNKRTVHRTMRQGLQQPGLLGRHNGIDKESEQTLVAMLLEAFRAAAPMNKKQLLQIVHGRYRTRARRVFVNAFIGRHLDALQTCRSIAQEDTRLAVPRSPLEEHLHILQVHLAGKCAEVVFNLDELGSTDWQDRKIKKVIAPAAVSKEDAYHSVSRRPRQMTLLACVSAARDAVTTLLITTTSVDASLRSRSVGRNEDVMVRRRTPPYIDEELFFE